MTCISTISTQARLDVQELLSHFSHFLDHNQGRSWAELFTIDGTFECGPGNVLQGEEELATVPARVHELGHGGWRHVITAVAIERTNSPKHLVIRAYCPVMDLNESNALAAFFDFQFTLRFASRWRIQHAQATRVGAAANHYVGIGVGAPAPEATHSLQ